MPGATLLFAHGGGFCKQIWDPFIRRLKNSPLVQQVATEFVVFDFLYHGGNDLVPWTTAEVQRQVQLLEEKYDTEGERPELIGIGHSMGAGALWNTEDPAMTDKIASFLVATTLQRKASWSSRQEAVQYFEALKNFNSWDRESLAAYLQGALVDEATEKTVLACHPRIEASLYCHEILRFSDHELKRPKCSVRFYGGERSNLFFTPYFEHAMKLYPDIYSIGEPMKNCTHLLVLEDPQTATTKILNDLMKITPFCKKTPSRL
ncbi:Alpha/Beta hydrolase fold [Phytophthora cactorum]|nr:Alpha/Beta hydrolase fold [Phytophthora cactorum]